MRRKGIVILLLVLALALGAGIGVWASGTLGSESDPLITKSYLDQVVQPQLQQELSAAVEDARQTASAVTGTFQTLDLRSGQSLTCAQGTEVLLCSGVANALGSLCDTTEGAAVSSGQSLRENHLYMASEPGAGLRAAGAVTVMVTGDYSLS